MLVLKLAAPLSMPTIELAGPADVALSAPGSVLTATGWGLTDYKKDDSQPQALKQADIPVVRDSTCSLFFGAAIFNPTFQLCGQSPGGRPDTCQGDSGGPLVGGPLAARRLVGIVSYGPTSCGAKGGSAVYADVASERTWILQAAGLPDAAPFVPGQTPPAVRPPAAKRTVKLRFGRISCSSSTCSVTIRASGAGKPDVRDVMLRVVRKGQGNLSPAKRFARAKKVQPGMYKAKTLLPYGTVDISAVAYDVAGAQLGSPVREEIDVVQ